MTPVHQLATLRAYHLPPTMSPRFVRTVRHAPAILEVVDEAPAYYRALTRHLRAAHAAIAPHLTDHHVIALLVEAARRWRDPDHPFRRLALSVLPALTGYAPAMIEEGLDHRLAQLTPERLGRLVDDTADRLAEQGRRRQGPPVVLLVLAGHIPGLVIDDVAAMLLARSACVIRPSARDPVIPPLFVRTLAELDPRMGELLAVTWWPREAVAVTAAAGGSVDGVVASGDDATIADLARHTARIIGYGHRRSVALIGAEMLTDAGGLADQTVERLARDVCWYEQQGCLAPHLVYVETGGGITPREYAGRLAAALEREAQRWPPSAIPIDAASAILQLRAEIEFREPAGAQVLPIRTTGAAMGGSGGEEHLTPELSERSVRADLSGGTVLYDPDPTPRPSPGYRTLWVKPVVCLEQAPGVLTPWQGRIESFGLALSDERRAELQPPIDRLAPSRLAPIGTMQEPPLRWRLLDQGLLIQLSEWTGTPSVEHS
jgi:Acyl-CoA reductase (LuxC)